MSGNGLPITPCACQIRQMLLTNPSLVSPQVQVRDILGYSLPVLLMALLFDYFMSVKQYLIQQHKGMHKRARRNRQILQVSCSSNSHCMGRESEVHVCVCMCVHVYMSVCMFVHRVYASVYVCVRECVCM